MRSPAGFNLTTALFPGIRFGRRRRWGELKVKVNFPDIPNGPWPLRRPLRLTAVGRGARCRRITGQTAGQTVGGSPYWRGAAPGSRRPSPCPPGGRSLRRGSRSRHGSRHRAPTTTRSSEPLPYRSGGRGRRAALTTWPPVAAYSWRSQPEMANGTSSADYRFNSADYRSRSQQRSRPSAPSSGRLAHVAGDPPGRVEAHRLRAD